MCVYRYIILYVCTIEDYQKTTRDKIIIVVSDTYTLLSDQSIDS